MVGDVDLDDPPIGLAGGDQQLQWVAEAAVAQAESQHVLEQLGAAPFRKGSFPVIGFLSSLYEHVAAHVSAQNGRHSGAGGDDAGGSPPQGF